MSDEGRIALLLTDVEGSTRIWERDPDLARSLLAEHDTIVAAGASAHRGALIRNRAEGDSAFVVFDDAGDAVRCAVDLQRALAERPAGAGSPIRVRIGIHEGTPHRRGGQLYGPVVNRCGAVRNLGHGGQVLLSSSVAAAVGDAVELRDLGEHRLKGLNDRERIYQVVAPGLTNDFPPLRSSDEQRHNLPERSTTVVGTSALVAQVLVALEDTRLLTLVGIGGLGKTTLALEVASARAGVASDGVWFVEMGGLTDQEEIVEAIAVAAGVREQPGRPMGATLVDHFRSRDAFLVLDGCEPAAPSVAALVRDLVRGPRVRVLATSRMSLGLSGERVWPLAALPATDAVELFLDRTRGVDLGGDPGAMAAITAICNRLDGIPLAIEVTAARTESVSPAQVLAELEQRLAAHTIGDEDRAVHAALDAAHDHLLPAERRLFRRTAIFTGGFTLEAAEGVCVDASLPEPEILDALTGLVARSLVAVDDRAAGIRYRSLDTVRAHATSRLEEAGEVEALQLRHRRWFGDLVLSYGTDVRGTDQAAALDVFEADHENLQRALEPGGEGSVDDELWLAAILGRFWEVRGHWSLGLHMLQNLLAQHTELHQPRALAESGAAHLATLLGDYEVAARHCAAAVASWTALEVHLEQQRLEADSSELRQRIRTAQSGRAQVLHRQCELARLRGDLDAALALGRQALHQARALNDGDGVFAALGLLGVIEWARGDLTAAADHMTESLELGRRTGDPTAIAMLLNNLGALEWLGGGFDVARALYEESLDVRRRLGDRAGIAQSMLNLADLDLAQGRDGRALGRESLGISRELGHPVGVAEALRLLGELAAAAGDLEEAEACYEESAAVMDELGDVLGRATVDLRHARIDRRRGDALTANERAMAALQGHLDAGDTAGATSCRAELVLIACALGDAEAVRNWLREAVSSAPDIPVITVEVLEAAAEALTTTAPDVARAARSAVARWGSEHGVAGATASGGPTLVDALALITAQIGSP